MTTNITFIGNQIEANAKIAAFDFDWTLVKPKDNRTFPKSVDDWQWLFPLVPTVLNKLKSDGYKLVIFTNQSKPWKEEMITNVMAETGIDACAIAWNKDFYKGSNNQLLLFNTIASTFNVEESFFVGDALGRSGDFSDSDRMFANAVGLKCMAPEELFLNTIEITKPTIQLKNNNENTIIVLVGYPGSGKTTLSMELEKQGAFIIHCDKYKTVKQIINAAEHALISTQSPYIVFDATNGTVNKRNVYLEFANTHNINTRICINITTDIETAYARNKLRENPVPRIAYSVYKKHYVEPSLQEGFTEIINY